jgi:hypothetical protein
VEASSESIAGVSDDLHWTIFLNVTLPAEPNCTRKCIYDSMFIQVIYSSGGSMLLGYGIALIYWCLANSARFYFCGGEKNE